MRVDVNLIERAEMLVAEVVHALFNRTADMRILAFFHEDTPFRAAAFSAACRYHAQKTRMYALYAS